MKLRKTELVSRFDSHKVLAALTVLLLVAVLLTKLAHAGLESTIWMDEVFSLELATKDAASIVELSSQDVHPPLYYLALRAWIAAGTHLGLDESIGLARSMNVFVWALLIAATYGLLRRQSSVVRATLGAGLMGLSPGVIQLTQDARSYGFALLGVTAAFLALALDLDDLSRNRSQRRSSWPVYTLGMLLATCSHNLSWFAAVAMMVAWFIARLRVGGFTPRALLVPVLANLLVVACAGPWLLTLSTQVNSLTTSAPSWMTPPTVGNLLRVFVLWLPLGRDAGSFLAAYPWLWAIVILAWGTLVLAVFAGRSDRWLALAGKKAFGLVTSVLFVGLLWGCSRWLNLPIFHGPRYPLLIAGVWAAGLWSVLPAENERATSILRGWLFAAPWLACGALSLTLTFIQESRTPSGILAGMESRTETSGAGSYLPSELGPYFRKTLRRLPAVPLVEAGCQPAMASSRELVLLNPWRGLDTPAALLQISALKMGLLGEYETIPLPPATRDFELVRFKSDEWAQRFAERVCPALDRLRSKQISDPSVQRADLTKQIGSDGWSYLEFDRRLQPFRWTNRRLAALRFERALAEGHYELRVVGRLGAGDGIEIEVPSSALKKVFSLENPEFDLIVPFVVGHGEKRPLLVRLTSDVKQVKAGGQETYFRDLGLLLREASVHRAP